MIGFYCFTQAPPVATPTVKEQIALLSAGTKTAVLNSFIQGITPNVVEIKLGLPLSFVSYIYEKLEGIRDRSKELVIADNNITQVNLEAILGPEFDDFTSGQITAIVNAMTKWSKHDGSGTFAFYKSQIIL